MPDWLENLATWLTFACAVALGVAIGNILTLVVITQVLKVITP